MEALYDVVIIGAGISGNAAAKFLADRGWKTALIERKSFPRHKVCGEFLSPESFSMLRLIGADHTVLKLNPNYIDHAGIYLQRGGTINVPLPSMALGVSRFSMDQALLRAARQAGIDVLSETSVTAVVACDNGYRIMARCGANKYELAARTVIAASGAQNCPPFHRNNTAEMTSDDCNRQGIDSMRSSSKRSEFAQTYVGVKAHFNGAAVNSAVELYFVDGGYAGVSSVENGKVNVAALFQRDFFQRHSKTVLGSIEAACAKHPALGARLLHADPISGTEAAVAPIDLRRKPILWDGFARIGDAAVMIPPLCGDGMSIALRSAIICSSLAHRYLKKEISAKQWQSEYEKAAKQQFSSPRLWGKLLQKAITVPYLPDILLPAARWIPGIATGLIKATRLKDNHTSLL